MSRYIWQKEESEEIHFQVNNLTIPSQVRVDQLDQMSSSEIMQKIDVRFRI